MPLLGHLRLRCVELVYLLLKIGSPATKLALAESEVFGVILDLVLAYPWNNFIQLKAISIFEEIFENNEDGSFRAAALRHSDLLKKLMNIAENPTMLS